MARDIASVAISHTQISPFDSAVRAMPLRVSAARRPSGEMARALYGPSRAASPRILPFRSTHASGSFAWGGSIAGEYTSRPLPGVQNAARSHAYCCVERSLSETFCATATASPSNVSESASKGRAIKVRSAVQRRWPGRPLVGSAYTDAPVVFNSSVRCSGRLSELTHVPCTPGSSLTT